MEYDFRTKPYDSQPGPYGRTPSSASSVAAHTGYGQPTSLYPKIGGSSAHPASSHGGAPHQNPPFHHAPTPPTSSGIGIRVAVKPEYRLTAPPPLLPQLGDIPRSNFRFDFRFERDVITEAVKESPNWSRLGIENVVPKPTEVVPAHGPGPALHIVSKYIAAGLSRDAVPIAVANYGDNPIKVKEFSSGFTLLREMGGSRQVMLRKPYLRMTMTRTRHWLIS